MRSIITNDYVDTTNISNLIKNQFPDFYLQDGPLFVEFMTQYYAWLMQSGNVGYNIRNFLKTRNIDYVDPNNISELFFAEILPSNVFNSNFYIQHILDVYRNKGSAESFKLLFKILYNTDIVIYSPGTIIFKPSNSQWSDVNYLEVFIKNISTDFTTYLNQFLNQTIIGTTSGDTCVLVGFNIINNENIILNISNISGNFVTNEQLQINNVVTNIFIKGSLKYITITNGGGDFDVNETLSVTSYNGYAATAEVISTYNQPGIIDFSLVNGGVGYGSNTIVQITNATNDPGAGAFFNIQPIIPTSVLYINSDLLLPYANIPLNSNTFSFAKNNSVTLSTPLSQALTYSNYPVGTILGLENINPGRNYQSDVTIVVYDPVVKSLQISDNNGNIWGNDAIITGTTGSQQNTISTVAVTSSGFGFLPGDSVFLVGNNKTAFGYAGVGSVGFASGYWKTNNNELDGLSAIQDSDYIQTYSYEIQTSISQNIYDSIVQSDFHLVGYKQFHKTRIINTVSGLGQATLLRAT
jgi:hypothetical protein